MEDTSRPGAMTPLLRSVALELVARRGADLSDACIVLPGKRAALFMRRHLETVVAQQYSRPLSRRELPLCLTLMEFVEKVSGLRQGSRPELLFTLYEAWCKVRGGEDDFEQFRPWADTLLSDFDEVDAWGVDAHALFSNIERHNEISADYLSDEQRRIIHDYFGVDRNERTTRFWEHFAGDGTIKQRFRALWRQLAPLYDEFRSLLVSRGYSYPGAMTRQAVKHLDSLNEKNTTASTDKAAILPRPHVAVVGLDMLDSATLALMHALYRLTDKTGEHICDFFWDAPGPALAKNSPVGAGRFQWKNMEMFPPVNRALQEQASRLPFPPTVDVVACPGGTAQAKVAGMLLQDIVQGRGAPYADPARVAVVLPDEGLLFPVFHSIPPSVSQSVNLTMGYPARHTSVAALLALLRAMQTTARHSHNSTAFHHDRVKALLSHPLAISMLGVEQVLAMRTLLHTGKYFYITRQRLEESAPSLTSDGIEALHLMLAHIPAGAEATQAIEWLRNILRLALKTKCHAGTPKQNRDVETLVILSYMGATDQLETLLASHSIPSMAWGTALTMIERMLHSSTIHLQGEPLRGVQVMGMLETRALDFDYLIVLSMNESVFPRRQRPRTFIPESLRRGWGLPTLRTKEQAWAYHFYRLIARAKEVHLLYDASQGGKRSGDPSRYLLQLKYLLGKESKLRWRSARFAINASPKLPLCAPKHAEDLEPYLTEGSGKHFSASMLKTYMDCPFRFYLSYVLRKKVEKVPDEFIDAARQGTVMHDSMQDIYDSLLDPEYLRRRRQAEIDKKAFDEKPAERLITRQTIEGWLSGETLNIASVVWHQVQQQDPAAARMDTPAGASLLAVQALETYVRTCLEADLQLTPFKYIDNEHKLFARYPLPDGRKVNMTFIIDRLDKLTAPDGSERLRIVDYKTGSDDTLFRQMAELFGSDHSKRGIFQLFLYSLLLPMADEERNPGAPTALSIYATRGLELSGYDTMVSCQGQTVWSHLPYLKEFRERLDEMLSEIFSTQGEWRQCADAKGCTWCDFKEICGRT